MTFAPGLWEASEHATAMYAIASAQHLPSAPVLALVERC